MLQKSDLKNDIKNSEEILRVSRLSENTELNNNYKKLHKLSLSLHEKLKKRGATSDLIKISLSEISFTSNLRNSSMRSLETEYEHCMNNAYYYYNLSLQDCFSGPSLGLNGCIYLADYSLAINMINCDLQCSGTLEQVCP